MNAIVVFEYFFLIYKLKSPKKIFKDYNTRKDTSVKIQIKPTCSNDSKGTPRQSPTPIVVSPPTIIDSPPPISISPPPILHPLKTSSNLYPKGVFRGVNIATESSQNFSRKKHSSFLEKYVKYKTKYLNLKNKKN